MALVSNIRCLHLQHASTVFTDRYHMGWSAVALVNVSSEAAVLLYSYSGVPSDVGCLGESAD
eukprot:40384-Amphidinium_carterae.1